MDNTAVSPDLINAIYHHTRIKERCIGVDFDSDKVTAVYRLLEDLTLQETAQKNLRIELVLQFDSIQKQIKEQREKGADFDQALNIAKRSELAAAMMSVLDG